MGLCLNVDNAVILLIGRGEVCSPENSLFVDYSQGRHHRFGQATPAPVVDDLRDCFSFYSESFSMAGMKISFLLNSTKPFSCISFSSFETLMRVSSIKPARSSIFIFNRFSPSGLIERDKMKLIIFSLGLPI